MRRIRADAIPAEFYTTTGSDDMPAVRDILSAVRTRQDAAVREYTEYFDGPQKMEITDRDTAYGQLDADTINAIRQAAERIRLFARKQMEQCVPFETTEDGVTLGQDMIPIEQVGCYVPGGGYPLPSSALMSIVPARVAGVSRIVVCSPRIQPATIVAADVAGADRIYSIGGVQAIGAMAYGTESVPAVDKIVGPGNSFVTAAKKEVFGRVGIDLMAGPSEVLIIADESADPRLVAADLLAQAEHDPAAKADLVTTSSELADSVEKEVQRQLADLPTADIAARSIEAGFVVMTESLEQAARVSNTRAPEHLEVQVQDEESLLAKLTSYGSLFIGENAAEALGDYCTGTNHILPTGGAARYTGGLSVRDFLRFSTYQGVQKEGAGRLIDTAATLATVEGLQAHRRAAEIRRG